LKKKDVGMNEQKLERTLETMRNIVCNGETLGVDFEIDQRNREAAYKAWLELETSNAGNKSYH
jgi:hypothetical protein